MTISAGVASGIVDVAEGQKDILKQADMALYKAKQSGRNRVCAASQLKE
jgi:PleD family two-component response regulator